MGLVLTWYGHGIENAMRSSASHVELTGSGSVRGSIVAETFSAQGAATVTFEGDESELPDIKLEEGMTEILSWI